MIAYRNDFVYPMVYHRVFRTQNNDRSRSRLSSRKGHGFDFDFVNKYKDTFARELGEFGKWWSKEINGKGWNAETKKYEDEGEMSSPRQVLAGLKQFFELELDKILATRKKAHTRHIKATYQAVFLEIEKLMQFPDPD